MASRCSIMAACGGAQLARLLLALASLATCPAGAASRIRIEVAQIDAPGVRIDGLVASARLDTPSPGLRVEVEHMTASAPTGELRQVAVTCPALWIRGNDARCDAGQVRGSLGVLGVQRLRVSLRGNPVTARYHAGISDLEIAGGRGSLQVAAAAARMDAAIDISGSAIDRLIELSGRTSALPAGMTVTGRLDTRARIRLDERGASGITATLHFDAAGYASTDGRDAAENLAGTLDLDVSREKAVAAWHVATSLHVNAGALYSDPVYLEFGGKDLTIGLDGRIDAATGRLAARRFSIQHSGIARLAGTGEFDLRAASPLRRLRLELVDLDMAGAAPAYLQPVLISTDFKDLQAAGHIHGGIDIDEGSLSRLDLTFDGVTVDSTTGALSLDGLAGRLFWVDEDLRRDLAIAGDSSQFYSRLHFDAARIWGIEIGAATVPFTTSGRHFRLLDPLFLPIFDGGLAIQTLRVRHAGTPKKYVRFDAELRPISLGSIAAALELPRFEGTLSGRIPGIEVRGDTVTTRGNLEMAAFDGKVTVRDLRLKDPLGQYPQLFASIDVDALDLAQLTSTFSFGMITGRLSGRVEGLETFNWLPVALDARFFTTPGDDTPHRISQRAVANLSSIGGGSSGSISGALQSGFLRFFEQFHYRRLGLSCRLRNDICEMDGVAPAGNGYYIVQGSGLPRIDVIGSQRRVAWSRLVRQLRAISTSGGPVVR